MEFSCALVAEVSLSTYMILETLQSYKNVNEGRRSSENWILIINSLEARMKKLKASCISFNAS